MRSIIIILTLTALTTIFGEAHAQEGLYPLMYNEVLRSNSAEPQTAHRSITRNPFVYDIDTIGLPFFDDFTQNRIKVYDAEKDEDRITLKVLFGFEVNDQHPVTIDLVFEETYSVTKPISGALQYDVNPTLYVTYYDSAGEPIGQDTGWTTVITEFDQSTGLVTYDTIAAETTLVNTFDTLYVVDDDPSLWVTPANEANRGGAFVNNSFSQNTITYGVASFDGTDALGVPYDITSSTSQGPADTLESKPLLLNSEMEDVFLTFFYQAGGFGNEPEEEDTLVVEFFNVETEQWTHVWSRSGELDEPDAWSNQVWLRVDGADYLQPGFKFRFRNYATLSAQMDLWNIDYVRLHDGRDSTLADTISDVAFVEPTSSYTGIYTSVPWKHYLEDYASLQGADVTQTLHNLHFEETYVLSQNFETVDAIGQVVHSYTTLDPNLPAETVKTRSFGLPSEQIFPDNGDDFALFETMSWFKIQGGNDELINDTVTATQGFYNYYSYDDGTAEQAYALTGAGLQLAYGFTAPVGDSIRGIHFNFPQVLEDNAEELSFEIMVWEDTGSNPIYVSSFTSEPRYSNGNDFVRYNLEEAVYVEGDYLIGFRQIEPEKIYIGFDVNTESSDRIYYKSGNRWFGSSFLGSLLIRPDFGEDPTLSVSEKTKEQLNLKIYPNPSDGIIQFEASSPAEISIYNLQGATIWSGRITGSERLDLSNQAAGIYLIRAIDERNGALKTQKLVLTD
ncbi:MAG TPA: hypothetical protein DCX14_12705 [Flavobacteriales bacterium]|nr:hypothetical protein [Flavobacteriales bacterium]